MRLKEKPKWILKRRSVWKEFEKVFKRNLLLVFSQQEQRSTKGQAGQLFGTRFTARSRWATRPRDAPVFTVINFHATLLLVPSSLPSVTAFISPWLEKRGCFFSRVTGMKRKVGPGLVKGSRGKWQGCQTNLEPDL